MSSGDESQPLIGKVLGGCRIEALLGSGGMGAVYRGRHLSLQKDVAVKVMSPAMGSNAAYVSRFVSEAQLAAQLEHPNIVQVLNVGCENSYHFIVMQYIAGEPLSARIKKGPLDPREAVLIALCAAQGIAAAHKRGIVHRDIKPSNILLTATGEVKVADLGLAKVMTTTGDSSVTQAGTVLGTPDYMPPEQAEDARSADARNDIYSLGCTLYHILTGTPPFAAKSAWGIIQKHISEPVTPPIKARAGIPQELSDLVVRMMAKKRDERPQTMNDVIAALQRLAQPTAAVASAPRANPATPAAPVSAKSKSWMWIAAGVVALFLIVAVATRRSPAQLAYEGAHTLWEKNPVDYDGALANFEQVSKQFADSPWAEKAKLGAKAVQDAREKAARTKFEQIQNVAFAATQQRDYPTAAQAWEDFPAALLTGDFVEKVRVAKLKTRLPVRVSEFWSALQKKDHETAINYLDPDEVANSGRKPTLDLLRLIHGVILIFGDLEGFEIKQMDFTEDVKQCNTVVLMKLFNKLKKEKEQKDAPGIWMVVRGEWYTKTK